MKQSLQTIVRKAGELILNAEAFRVEQKEGHANFVTSVDEEVQRFLIAELQQLLPGSCIIGEEQENEALTDAPTWVIDPLDGTTNFIHSYRFSAISVALLENRMPVLGVVYQPYTNELFFAEKGKGACLNDHPIHVSNTSIDHALIGFGTSPYNVELADKSMKAALYFLQHAADVRRCGSAALDLAYVAAGRQDVYFELILRPWDYAAGSLLVQEAGGCFAMPELEEADYGRSTAVLAANPECMKIAAEWLKPFWG
ncbi:MAG: inositol monophosphatase [Clostridia bacterium]|nr:inositol monophosphatase [Clostridia bacterium]